MDPNLKEVVKELPLPLTWQNKWFVPSDFKPCIDIDLNEEIKMPEQVCIDDNGVELSFNLKRNLSTFGDYQMRDKIMASKYVSF